MYFVASKFFFYIFISFCLVLLLVGIPYIVNFNMNQRVLSEVNIYECGFQTFGNIRNLPGIQYYLLIPLFLIFAVEISFLVPWIMSFLLLSNYGFFSGFFFLYVLFFGLIVEISYSKFFLFFNVFTVN